MHNIGTVNIYRRIRTRHCENVTADLSVGTRRRHESEVVVVGGKRERDNLSSGLVGDLFTFFFFF